MLGFLSFRQSCWSLVSSLEESSNRTVVRTSVALMTPKSQSIEGSRGRNQQGPRSPQEETTHLTHLTNLVHHGMIFVARLQTKVRVYAGLGLEFRVLSSGGLGLKV